MHVAEVSWVRRLAKSGGARSIRLAAGLSASELARELNVTPGAVSLWELGKRSPRGDVAERYAQLMRELAFERPAREMREAGFPASEPLADENVDANDTASR